MEATIVFTEKRLHTAIDIVCALTIGLGIGGLAMYWYAVSHPQEVLQTQSHVLITPKSITKDDSQAGKTSPESATTTTDEQI